MMCDDAGMTLEFQLIDTQDKTEFDLNRCLSRVQADGWAGTSVTHPFKPAAAAFADGPARVLGAANLVLFDHPPVALNTDYSGFVSAWQTAFAGMTPGRVVMAGAGGVARAIATALIELGAETVQISDLNAEKAAALADEIGVVGHVVPIDRLGAVAEQADGLVNATNMGMAGYGGSAFPLPLPSTFKWAFDAVYTPVETPFIQAAMARQAEILTGLDLFKHMAVNQFIALTGLTPANDILDRLNALKPSGVAV